MLVQSSEAHASRRRLGVEPIPTCIDWALLSVCLYPSPVLCPSVRFMASTAMRIPGLSGLCAFMSLHLRLLQTRAGWRLLRGCSCWTWQQHISQNCRWSYLGNPREYSTEVLWQCDIQEVAAETGQKRAESKGVPKRHTLL